MKYTSQLHSDPGKQLSRIQKFVMVKFREQISLKTQSNHSYLRDWTVPGLTLKVKLLAPVQLTIYSARDRISVAPRAHGGTRRAAASLAGS